MCVCVSVFISIFVFSYGTEKYHIDIVWYVAQSCELVITTSKISASRLKRCHYTKNYTPWYYLDELCYNNATQFLKWYIATNDLAMLVIFHN